MQIPAAYAATLAHVRASFPGALIAGGALRDLDNDRPVKDVDIFAPFCGPTVDEVHAALTTLPSSHKLVQVMGGYESWATEEVVGVFDMQAPDMAYQLIAIRTGPETILPRLDFGLCQIAFDGVTVETSEAYRTDKAAKTFTLVRSDDRAQFDRSYKRWERLSAKYPGWLFKDPMGLFGRAGGEGAEQVFTLN